MTTLTREEVLSEIRGKVARYLGSRTRATTTIGEPIDYFLRYINSNLGTPGIPAGQVDVVILYRMLSERLDRALEIVEGIRMRGAPVQASAQDLRDIFHEVKKAYADRFRRPSSRYH